MISTVILIKNEEQDLPGCLEALTRCDDVHVLDSWSTDRTYAITKDHGAHVSESLFRTFGQQHNYALGHLPLS